jgi:hypothetical protein
MYVGCNLYPDGTGTNRLLGSTGNRWDTVYGNTLNVTNITNPSAVVGYDVTLKLEGNSPNGCLISGEAQTVPLQI